MGALLNESHFKNWTLSAAEIVWLCSGVVNDNTISARVILLLSSEVGSFHPIFHLG